MIIKVNKLFGRYNNEIDLDKKINIFIGENGIGKSTTINLVNCLLKYDYIGLIKYSFDSIEIKTDNETVLIKYDDLILDKEYLIKKFCEGWNYDYTLYVELRKDLNELKKIYPDIDVSYLQEDMFIGINKKEMQDTLQFVYPFDSFCNLIDNTLMYKILRHNYNALNNSSIFKFNNSSMFLDYIYDSYSNADINKENGIYYVNSNVSNIHDKVKNIISRLQYNDIIMLNMASDFNVINDLNRKYATNDLEEEAMSNKYKEVLDYNKKVKSLLEGKTIVGADLYFKYRNIKNDEIKKKIMEKYKLNIPKKLDGNNIDFGGFLFNKLYSNNLIEEFKNDFYSFLHENTNEKLKKVRLSNKFFNIVRTYFYPLIPEKNMLNEIFKYDIREDGIDYIIGEESYLISEFYKKYKEKYFAIKDPRLEKLNLLFSKYFTNKEVIATPFGISISTKDFYNDISFDDLSSGEKKLIILFLITMFSDNLIILLDEPEMSLSVTWQKELLNDLIINSNYNRLIVTTQSPYIVSNDDLSEYLICLPLENKNE